MKIKKTTVGLITFLAISALPVFAASTNANTNNNSASSTGVRQELKDLRNEVKDNIKNRAENRYTKMLDRFQATIDRENAIMNRINSRIAKIKANGGKTTDAEKLVADAKTQLDAANAGLVTLTTLANTEDSLQNASTTIKALRDGLVAMRKEGADIQRFLIVGHTDLQKCVGVLRGMSQLKNATSTNSTATSTI